MINKDHPSADSPAPKAGQPNSKEGSKQSDEYELIDTSLNYSVPNLRPKALPMN
jgi:hypothetical protein